MKRLLLLLCIVFMASGCVPKANQFSVNQKKAELEESPATQSKAARNFSVLQATPGSTQRKEKTREVVAQIAGQEANKQRDLTHAECMVRAQTSFAVMLGDVISILSGEALWGDLFTITTPQGDPLKLRTTEEVVKTCLKSKGFPPKNEEEQEESPKPAIESPPPVGGGLQPPIKRK